MPSKFERKMISLPSQTCSRDHWKQKLHKRKTVGRKEFPGWHYLVDVEDNQTENDVPRDRYVEGCHHQDPCWYCIFFLPQGWMFRWTHILICAHLPWPCANEVLMLLPSFPHLLHLEYFYFIPKCIVCLTPEGWRWVQVILGENTKQPTASDYIPAGGLVFGPYFSSVW